MSFTVRPYAMPTSPHKPRRANGKRKDECLAALENGTDGSHHTENEPAVRLVP